MRARSALHGFTLIEVLVALAALAIMAGLGWRGLDAMTRNLRGVQRFSDDVQSLQVGLEQWVSDLDALESLPNQPALDWDGRALRILRRSQEQDQPTLRVVAWTRRPSGSQGQWLRWQSPALYSRGDLQHAWSRAALWAQNPGDADRKLEVALAPIDDWRIFYYRSDAWTNPLSSDTAIPIPAPPQTGATSASHARLPDGIRLELKLPSEHPVGGTLVRDWARLTRTRP